MLNNNTNINKSLGKKKDLKKDLFINKQTYLFFLLNLIEKIQFNNNTNKFLPNKEKFKKKI